MLNLKNVHSITEAEKLVSHVTRVVAQTLKLTNIKLSAYVETKAYYEALTAEAENIVVEVDINTFDAYVLLADNKGWRHIGKLV